MTLRLTTGDTAPGLAGTCTNKDPVTGEVTPAVLTGAAVALHIKRADQTILTKTATIVTAAEGTWSSTWTTGDLNSNGDWEVEAQVTYSDGKIQTFGPVKFAVKLQIA